MCSVQLRVDIRKVATRLWHCNTGSKNASDKMLDNIEMSGDIGSLKKWAIFWADTLRFSTRIVFSQPVLYMTVSACYRASKRAKSWIGLAFCSISAFGLYNERWPYTSWKSLESSQINTSGTMRQTPKNCYILFMLQKGPLQKTVRKSQTTHLYIP